MLPNWQLATDNWLLLHIPLQLARPDFGAVDVALRINRDAFRRERAAWRLAAVSHLRDDLAVNHLVGQAVVRRVGNERR